MLNAGQTIELSIEKPAAGGRMIARHNGQVVLVHGAIPGERVRARIDRVEKRLAFASVADVIEPSPDRREPAGDRRCGGCLYAHVRYDRQVALKREVIVDAFTRIGRIAIEKPIPLAPSPEHGHRLRARLHVRSTQLGFYLEGTHEICEPRATGQLRAEAIESAEATLGALRAAGLEAISIEVAENIAGAERALHIELAGRVQPTRDLSAVVSAGGLTGCTLQAMSEILSVGTPIVSDPLATLTGRPTTPGALARHPAAFFQANRFLVPTLVATVVDAVPADSTLVDLYAGVGLFSIALASMGWERITAVEADRWSGADLRENAKPWGASVRVVVERVERHLGQARRQTYSTMLIDPPRTGLSKDALAAVVGHGASRIVYVACDPPTMARDARHLLDAGYRLDSLQGFDLFPNTPHVEAVGVFNR